MNSLHENNFDQARVFGEIANALNSKDDSASQKECAIDDLITKYSWEKVAPLLSKVLLCYKSKEHAKILAEVFYCASLEQRDFDCNYIMALLLNCGIDSVTSHHAYNLILSTCVEMKGVEYQEYSPITDPEIITELNRVRKFSN